MPLVMYSNQCKRETVLERERVKRQASADQHGGGDNDQLEGGDTDQLGVKDESPPFNWVVHFGLSLPSLPHVCQVSQVPSLDEKRFCSTWRQLYYTIAYRSTITCMTCQLMFTKVFV